MDTCINNIYIPIAALSKGEQKFYQELYKYKKFCFGKKDLSFKNEDAVQQQIAYLNNLYGMIKDTSNLDVNSYGELEYPKVYYKFRELEGAKVMFICCADEEMSCAIPFQVAIPKLVIFDGGTIIEGKNISVETTGALMRSLYRKRKLDFASKGYHNFIFPLLEKMEKYPINSICELILSEEFSKEEVEALIKM